MNQHAAVDVLAEIPETDCSRHEVRDRNSSDRSLHTHRGCQKGSEQAADSETAECSNRSRDHCDEKNQRAKYRMLHR